MRLTRRELLRLCGLVTVAVLISMLLRTHGPIGRDINGNSIAREVQQDRTSPVSENLSADLTLVVFTDYRCPACRAAHSAMKRAVEKDGRVRIIYKDVPNLGEASEQAARVALAAGFQNIYPLVHDRFMNGRIEGEVALRAAVTHSGGDWSRLRYDLAQRENQILDQLSRNKMQAFGLGLSGTPGYLIGSILVRGALSESEFKRVFNEARTRG